MNKLVIIISFLLGMIALPSCKDWGYYSFIFYNNSEENINIVIDCNISDKFISVGSVSWMVQKNNWRYIDSKRPWGELVEDSAYVYVIDATKIQLKQGNLWQEDIDKISPEMILDRITFYHDETDEIFTLSFPAIVR